MYIMPEDRRKSVFKLHGEMGPDRKPVNAGWPNYVKVPFVREIPLQGISLYVGFPFITDFPL